MPWAVSFPSLLALIFSLLKLGQTGRHGKWGLNKIDMWPCRFSNMITCTEMVQTPILELVTCCPFDPLSPRGPCLPLAASANSVLRGNDNAWIELNIQLLQVEPARYHVARLLWCCGNLELLAEIFWFYDTTVSESWHPFFRSHPDILILFLPSQIARITTTHELIR